MIYENLDKFSAAESDYHRKDPGQQESLLPDFSDVTVKLSEIATVMSKFEKEKSNPLYKNISGRFVDID